MKIITIAFTIFLTALVCSAQAATLPKCSNCHDKTTFTGKIVHKPVSQNRCTKCHNPHVAKYKNLLQEQGGELCYSCHRKEKTAFAKGSQHQPVAEGECLACHNAHASDQKGLLAKPMAKLCFTCHEDLAASAFTVSHAPFKKGQCTACHTPHNADNDQLLKRSGDKLCINCHSQPAKLEGHAGFPTKAGQCLSCHNPHGSKNKGLIRNIIHAPFKDGCTSCHGKDRPDNTTLCLSCHQEVETQMQAPHSHMFAGETDCTSCHSPHTSDRPGLLKGPDKQLCKSCHLETFARNKKSRHPHPETDKCTDCHAPHGSKELVMLNADGNKVCSRCHETQGEFSHSVGPDIIDHRTGQSMSCLTCHDPMGSDYLYNLKLSGKKALCLQCHRSY